MIIFKSQWVGCAAGSIMSDFVSLATVHSADHICIIIITRPKPAYGRQGLAGSWGQDTDQAGTFLGVLNHENQPETLKNYKNRPGTMKNQPGAL